MRESSSHSRLVGALLSWLSEGGLADGRLVAVDSAHAPDAPIPPSLFGYVPDVFVNESGNAPLIVGEAKTARDLERQHSFEQLAAFLRWCSHHDGTLLVLAVPWETTRLARSIVRSVQAETGTQVVEAVVLDKLSG